MCPSYLFTREEKHSTRGRARLLNEMVRGDVVKDGWQSEAVRDALDLCLSCKGCKHDCPVQVDMAAYKAEFLSHYYERRLRPRYAYASGLIHWWARAASHMPAVANFFTQTPGLTAVAKFAAGYSQKRDIPRFAPETFKQWFARRAPRNPDKPPVILWADTFNNHFTPEVAQAAVEVLEDAGFRVRVPRAPLCCGRPLYDYGMLDTAKSMLRRILTTLREPIRQGIPIVGLEPSCMTVFRDELGNLFYGDEDAARLQAQSFILAEFLKQKNYRPPQLVRKALVHGHCHHKSLLNFETEVDLLKQAGVDCDLPDSGCCGMAGSFGYESDHYDVGLACGERALLPSVRAKPDDTLIVTDGFSCREMIRQETDRRPLHSAQLFQMALHGGEIPEPPKPRKVPIGILMGALAVGAFVFLRASASRR
jgi:Fe-S oxidoreductase